jgi:hypothetical protein
LKYSISDKSALRIKKLMDTLNNALGQEVGSVVTAVNNVKAIDKNGNVRELDQGAPVFRVPRRGSVNPSPLGDG